VHAVDVEVSQRRDVEVHHILGVGVADGCAGGLGALAGRPR
jgi:hypothetical protein